MSNCPEILTIGHSDHTLERFLDLLAQHRITAIADVRSSPYSARHTWFNRREFAAALGRARVAYSFLGGELGGRPADRNCYEEGRVQYAKIAATTCFRTGIERLLRGAEQYRIAVMCSEGEALQCHRGLLVAPEIVKAGVSVLHVRADGAIESHGDAMTRLLNLHNLPDEDLFRSRAEIVEEACYRQQQKIGFALAPEPADIEQAVR